MDIGLPKIKRQWTNQQTQLLQDNFSKHPSKRWKKLSEHFRNKGYQRSEIQIRQRWDNYDNPSLNFAQWNQVELKILYQSYLKYGTKWCLIKKTLQGRTQNKIKNKIYGNMRIFLRFVIAYMTKKNRKELGQIKYLQRVDKHLSRQRKQKYFKIGFDFFQNQMLTAIHSMNYKIQKIHLVQRIQQNKKLYANFAREVCRKFDPSFEQHQQGQMLGVQDQIKEETPKQNQRFPNKQDQKSVKMEFSQANLNPSELSLHTNNQRMPNYFWIPYYNSYESRPPNMGNGYQINFWG